MPGRASVKVVVFRSGAGAERSRRWGEGAQTMRAELRDAEALKQFAKLARCRFGLRRRARHPEHTARCEG